MSRWVIRMELAYLPSKEHVKARNSSAEEFRKSNNVISVISQNSRCALLSEASKVLPYPRDVEVKCMRIYVTLVLFGAFHSSLCFIDNRFLPLKKTFSRSQPSDKALIAFLKHPVHSCSGSLRHPSRHHVNPDRSAKKTFFRWKITKIPALDSRRLMGLLHYRCYR